MFREAELLFTPDFLVKSRVHPEQGTHKITNHLEECNNLWMGMISELTAEEMRKMDGSVLKFYKEEARFLEATPYSQAWSFTKHRFENTGLVLLKSTISVVIPFKNRINWLLEAIESVLSQTYKNIEIIVVDDSSDDDLSPLHNLLAKDGRIHYMRSNGKGVSAARNTGIAMATGAFIAFLDSDDLFYPEKLETQLKYMVSECLSFSHTSYNRMTNSGQILECMDTSYFVGNVFPSILCNCPVATPAVMADALLLKEHLFDEKIHIGEDTCLWIDIAYMYEFGAIKTPFVSVRIGETSAFQNKDKQLIGITNIMSHIAQNPLYKDNTNEIGLLASYLGRTLCGGLSDKTYDETPVLLAPIQKRKPFIVRFVQSGFRGIRRIAFALGLKRMIGRSRLYRRMEQRGTLQRLRG